MKSEKMNRREMMLKSALAVGGLALSGSCQRSAVEKSAGKSCGKGFKIGVCDWTIGKRANPESLALAKSIGLAGEISRSGKRERCRNRFVSDGGFE
jgi:hypothetical protein